ncbi:MAG: hypothetical protein Q4G70_06015 [Pseudomonadota bacterium]|nr:hypothetical protein [Pseudomonadota bacterium]
MSFSRSLFSVRRGLFALALLLVAVGAARAQQSAHFYAQKSATLTQALPDGKAALNVLREPGILDADSVNVLVDGHFFTALPEGMYDQVPLCAGQRRITLYSTRAAAKSAVTTLTLPFESGQTVYLRVALDGQQRLTLLPAAARVQPDQALQGYTLPRLPAACPASASQQ